MWLWLGSFPLKHVPPPSLVCYSVHCGLKCKPCFFLVVIWSSFIGMVGIFISTSPDVTYFPTRPAVSLSLSLLEIRDWPLPRRPRHLRARNGARSKSRKRKEDPPRSAIHFTMGLGNCPSTSVTNKKVNGAKSRLDSREIKASRAREADRPTRANRRLTSPETYRLAQKISGH